ncbi:hypothetical protein pb186bvf_017706 [Paramecium bursaria]
MDTLQNPRIQKIFIYGSIIISLILMNYFPGLVKIFSLIPLLNQQENQYEYWISFLIADYILSWFGMPYIRLIAIIGLQRKPKIISNKLLNLTYRYQGAILGIEQKVKQIIYNIEKNKID